MENLKNKISLITGGNSGIGYATTKEMKTQGGNSDHHRTQSRRY
jgi:NADP-dependent 3-hydroxy acid dehydrogenase YdfG